MTFLSPLRSAAQRLRPEATPHDAEAATPAAPTASSGSLPLHRRGRVRLAAAATAVAVVATGTVATAAAHKTVTLDVDGTTTTVATFAGSVDGLLEDAGVELGARDVVAPGTGDALRDGSEVVVRRARQVTVLHDGLESTLWTTALSADEALMALADRGADVRLVASRSGGRADLGLRLDHDGPVDVVVDGTTHTVEDGFTDLGPALQDLGIALGSLDRVHATAANGRLTVTIQRVVEQEVPEVLEVPFATLTEATDELYRGESRTAVEGVVGERTIVHRVVLVDGVEESRETVSDSISRAPVDQVVQEGSKVRPAPAPRPRPAGTAPGAAPSSVPGDVWAQLAQCESGGNPTIVSRNGLYHGLYQFSVATWQSVGGTGLPSDASAAEQTQRAQALQARSGWGQWPACARKLGLI